MELSMSNYGRIDWQDYSGARPISPRAEGTLERLLQNDVEQAKRELQREASKEHARVEKKIREEHQAPDVSEIKDAARGAVNDFLSIIKELKRRADNLGVDLSVPAVERFLSDAEEYDGDDDYPDDEDLFVIATNDRSLQRKLAEARREVDTRFREVCAELDNQVSLARRHILVAALSEEEQKVLSEVPKLDELKQRLQLPLAT